VWIVRLALRRPYTFVVMAVLIAVLGVVAISSTPKDIFPYINLPVASVVWSYSGLSPEEMANRVVTVDERAMTTVVNDIEHMESTSYNGIAVIRVFFQPNVKIEMSIAQITAMSQSVLRVLVPGIFAPNVIKYDASSVPILQLSVGSDVLTEAQLNDYATNFIRTGLATVQGASVPTAVGGKTRAIMVDLNPDAMFAKRVSATEVSNAINLQSLILPAGTAKVGDREYFVRMNSSPDTVAAINDLPVKAVNGAIVYIKDVAQVRDGNTVQTSIVRTNGRRAALLTVLRNGAASTLDIVREVKNQLPRILAGLPKELRVTELVDQSLFVRAAINDVVREGVIAAFLTGLMILLFLGSWRSTMIVCISIPLSVLTSIVILSATGQSINVMTLGGLALSVGILVDNATVAIENIHRNLAMKKPLVRAVLDGTQQVALPVLVSTLAISIAFVPVLLLRGAASFLFTPMAMAVVFAMVASYFLSFTLLPTMVHYMLPSEMEFYLEEEAQTAGEGIFRRMHRTFHRLFEKMRVGYRTALDWCLDHRGIVLTLFLIYFAASMQLMFLIGRDFFPYVDSGMMRLHVRAPQGTRIEETERIFARVEQEIRRLVPAEELQTMLDNIGLPSSGLNLAYGDVSTLGPSDGEILISLNPVRHAPTLGYERLLREDLRAKFPDETFFFQAANITNQILNFGVPAPIDIQIAGRNLNAGYQIAKQMEKRVAAIPGAVDVHIRQEMNVPTVYVDTDRTKASLVGITQRDIANSMLISLSSSGQVAPNQWLNPVNGVNYQINVQTPQHRVDSFDALNLTPITGGALNTSPQLLRNLATLKRTSTLALVNHYNVQPIFDVYANVDQRDLGSVANEVNRIIGEFTPKLPPGAFISMRGQVETMQSSFVRLGFGLVFAIVLVYLLMVVNFQSWLDPFIILMAVPGALSGILWMLFLTGTTLSVPSLMGCIMSIGVGTANSILLVVFANDLRKEGIDARKASLLAGFTRLRPVLMTALAMIIGMLPMALAMGEGGEQNAPLGRAVVGGLIMATFTTLFFVPVVYSYLRMKPRVDLERRFEEESR